MVPLQIEIDGHRSPQRLRIIAEGQEITDDKRKIVELKFHIKSCRLDFQPRITAEINLNSPVAYLQSTWHESIPVRIRNVGWSDIDECKFKLSGSELQKVLVGEYLAFEVEHLASGETYVFELRHTAVDKKRLQTLYDERLNQIRAGAELSFEEMYDRHLENLRAPAVRLNQVRQKNYERMTALGRDWKYDPVAVPHYTEEERSRFRDKLAARGKQESWPTISDVDLTYELRSSDGSYFNGIVHASYNDLQNGKIRIESERFWHEVGHAFVSYDEEPWLVSAMIRLDDASIAIDIEDKWGLGYGDHFPITLTLSATQSCWADIAAEVILTDGSELRSSYVPVHVLVERLVR